MRASSTICLVLVLASSSPLLAETPRADGPKVPVDLVWLDAHRLAVPLREAREVAVVDVATRKVARVWPLAFPPRAVTLGPPNRLLVAGRDGELAAVDSASGHVIYQTRIGRGPARVVGLPDGKAVCNSLWEDQAKWIDADSGRVLAVHRLPFAPGSMVATPGGRVIVAAAFGGELADLVPGLIGSERIITIPGASLDGLTISGDGRELIIAHVLAEPTGPITKINVDWGLIVSSKMSVIRLNEFGSTGRPINFRRLTLDGSLNGAADPSAVTVARGGKLVLIALAGAHKILGVDRTKGPQAAIDVLPLGDGQFFSEYETGRSPVALAVDPTGQFVASADAMSDEITVVDLDGKSSPQRISVGNSRTERSSSERGEALFRDGRLALDRWMSCATCHPGGHTIGRNFDTLGDGDHGDAKDTLSLLGVRSTPPYAWSGRFPTLQEQVRQSVESSMQGDPPTDEQVSDLVAYLNTLTPPPPRRPATDPDVALGADLFESRSCSTCHAPPLYTSRKLREVGFRDHFDKVRLFNPPSLRGVSRSAPYLHDGRARSLEDLLHQHHPGFEEPPDASETQFLKAFLESL